MSGGQQEGKGALAKAVKELQACDGDVVGAIVDQMQEFQSAARWEGYAESWAAIIKLVEAARGWE